MDTREALAGMERRSYWQATMPDLPDRSATELPGEVDVLVVGGGYTGVSAARTLARRGATVALVEAERLGWGASTRNGGIVHPGYKWGPDALVRRYGEDTGRALYRETLDGYEFLKRLIAEEGIDAAFEETGYVELAYAPGHAEHLERARAGLDSVGARAEVVPRAAVRSEIGTDAYYGALVVPASGGLHPGAYFAGLAVAAERAGAGLHENARALRLEREPDGRLRVTTTRGSVRGREVLVATNGYTDGFVPALRRRIIPIGSYIIATEQLPADLVQELSPKRRMFFDTKNFLYYWRVFDRRMIFGGRASFMPTTVDRTAAILHRGLLEVHRQLRDYRIEFAWGGKVGFTFDRMPHAGRLRSGVSYAMGYCGTGVVMATYLGARMGDWLCGDEPPALVHLPFPVVPAPYEGRPWFLPLAGEWYRLQDRLAARTRD